MKKLLFLTFLVLCAIPIWASNWEGKILSATTSFSQTRTGPVEADGTMTYDRGSYQVHAVYDAENSKLTLTGVGGKASSKIIFDVNAVGSLVSDTNQLYGWDTDYDPYEETMGRDYEVYYSDNPVTTPYRVTGTAANSGDNCVLTLGNIGAFTTLDDMWFATWNNTVITLNDLNLEIETAPSISITDVDMKETESGYDFTVTLTSDNITEDITVSYTVKPTIENQSEVTENADGTYTFTISSASLTSGTTYTVTISASAGNVKAADVTQKFTTAYDDSDITTAILTGNYQKFGSYSGYFIFDDTATNPFGTEFSLLYYPSSSSSTGSYQKLGLYRTNEYTLADGKYVFVTAGSINEDGVVKPLNPSSDVSITQNQMVFSQETGLFESGLYEKSGNSYREMPNAVICVVECSMKSDPGNDGAPAYTVDDVKKVFKFLGGRYGKSLGQQTAFPEGHEYDGTYINFVTGTDYFWTLQLQEVKDFHYGDFGSFVESVEAADADAHYFTLQGVEIRNPESGTICIKVSGNKATKVIIR